MTTKYLTSGEVAEMLGLSKNTVAQYATHGKLPEPDAVMGQGANLTRGWLPETIEAWNQSRPGSGNWGSGS